MKAVRLILPALLAFGGCAPAADPLTITGRRVTVSEAEVADFLRGNWETFAQRRARQRARTDPPSLVAIQSSRCTDFVGAADCQIDTIVEYGGERAEETFRITLDRQHDGSLIEVIILAH